jgi:hypothetical protein
MQEDIIPASLQLLNSNLLLVPLGQWVHVLGTASSTLPHPVPTLELPCSYHRLRSSNPAASASHQHPHPTGKIRTTLTPHHHSPVTSKLLCYSRIQVPGRREKKKSRGEKKCFRQLTWSHNCCCCCTKKTFFFSLARWR